MTGRVDKRERRSRGLQREIVTYLAALAFASILIVALLLVRTSRGMLDRQAIQSAEKVTSVVVRAVEQGWDGDLADGGAKRLLDDLPPEAGVARWSLGRPDGGETASSVRAELGAAQEASAIRLRRTVTVGGRPVATLGLVFGREPSAPGLARLWWTVLAYVVSFTLILVWFGFRLVRQTVIYPLQRIEKAASAVASGDVARKVPAERENEIGRLGEAIETMRARLLEDQEKLADYARSLERLNQELEEAQKALLRGETLASVGRLAAGVAHEIGNPLGAIGGYLSMLRSHVSAREVGEMLERAEREVGRIGRIVRQLLDYSRPPQTPDFPADLNDVVRATVEGLRAQSPGKEPGVELDLAGDLPPCRLDPDRFRQVLWNLLRNAADVVGARGTIRVRTEKLSAERFREEPMGTMFRAHLRKGDRGRPEILALRRRQRSGDGAETEPEILRTRSTKLPSFLFSGDGEVIRIQVEDTGPGIPPEEIGKIFDPFFTTKPPGEGTGLGLFISLKLVESMGGFLDVRSEPGKGTTFMILLPAPEAATQSLRG